MPSSPHEPLSFDGPAIHLKTSDPSLPNRSLSRTVAIIKSHALRHRFDIERRIQEASFEIVKERQIEFDTETDFDTLKDLFGSDAASLSHGPVWVYVLERRRAVEVWKTVMGDADPEAARQNAPNSLRAQYGHSVEENAVMGSPNAESAELQITSIFASSPVFPTTDLPDDHNRELNSLAFSGHSRFQSESFDSAHSKSNPPTAGGSSGKHYNERKPTFRARAVPSTTSNPDIVPRMTRSAALRAGMIVDKTEAGPRTPLSKEESARTFANVPGHKRAEVISVPSTASPAITPRMTRAASLRLGITPASADVSRRKSMTYSDAGNSTFEGIPGHKRRESISVASTKVPTLAPKLNKSANLRASKEQIPPTSFMFKGSVSKTTSPSGISSSGKIGSSQVSTPLRPSSQMGNSPVVRCSSSRPSSVIGYRRRSISPSDSPKTRPDNDTPTNAKHRPRPSGVCPPTISPRTNRSASLRAANREADKTATPLRNARPRVAPSSFKPITAV